MVESEREMIQRPELEPEPMYEERFTSLQPTYEDTVPQEPDDWDEE